MIIACTMLARIGLSAVGMRVVAEAVWPMGAKMPSGPSSAAQRQWLQALGAQRRCRPLPSSASVSLR